MKNLVVMAGVAAVVGCACGCKSLVQDASRSDLKTQLVPAKFKPTVEVLKDKGVVRGSATESYWFWFVGKDTPETFANEIVDGNSSLFIPSVENAAVYDACKKSGASILLAPRFTFDKTCSFLWFSGRTIVTVEGVPARVTGAEEIPVSDWPVVFGTRSGTQKIVNTGK